MSIIELNPGTDWDVITDGDDTLWECGIYYDAAARDCLALVLTEMPDLNPEAIRMRCRRIQAALIKKLGYYYELYEDAWVETYAQECHQRGRQPSQQVEGMIYQVAAQVHDAPYTVYDGVHEALDQLRRARQRLHLLTLGDDAWQRQKVGRNGLTEFFDGSIHVVQRTKGPHMRLLARDRARTMMVGDSLIREINPAVRLGLTAVWIHSNDPWATHGSTVDMRKIHRLDHFRELPQLMASLNGHPPIA